MKGKIAVFGTLAALLLLTVAVYAHSNNDAQESEESDWMMSIQEMNDMHDEITRNLDPELKEEMDEMHDGCMSSISDDEENSATENMMSSTDSMMTGARNGINGFGGMMGMGGMMG